MIKKILLENFKAFEKAEIEIKPITILVGPNNAGKTSLMQSISLIQQTLRSGTEVLAFRGVQSLGDFDNVIHQDSLTKELRFRFEFEDETYFDFNVAKEKNGNNFVKNFSCNNGRFEYFLKNIKQKLNTPNNSEFYEAESFELKFPEGEGKNPMIKSLSNISPNFFRETFFMSFRDYREDDWIFSEKNNSKTNFSSRFRRAIKSHDPENENMYLFILSRLSAFFYQNIRQKFENIRYIGPIRAAPDRYYDSGSFENVGFKGEHAVQLIAKDPILKKKTEDVLKKLEIANNLEILRNPNSKNFEFKLNTGNTKLGVNFADVGCGTSQILPLIVQCLSLKDKSLIMIEQPELHLHPKVQADFGNFLVESANNNLKFIIETHSEYLIERIRTCIMKNPDLAKTVIIYYVGQNKEKNHSEIITIKINSEGQYSELPEEYLVNFKLKEINTQMDLMYDNILNKIGKE